MESVREQAKFYNERFSAWEKALGITLHKINVGEAPNDCTGDTRGMVIAKVIANVCAVIDAFVATVTATDEPH